MNKTTITTLTVLVALATLVGLAVIPALSFDANALLSGCRNPGKPHPGIGSGCPPGLAKRQQQRETL